MAIDVIGILRAYHVPHITEGKNVKKGNVNVKCPMCGPRDTSQHLGIHLKTGVYGCWRDPTHRGLHFARLLVHLLRITYREAEELVDEVKLPEGGWADLKARTKAFLGEGSMLVKKHPEKIVLPEEFKPLVNKGFGRRFVEYLETPSPKGRGFRHGDAEKLSSRYSLHYALQGPHAHRLILPFYVNQKIAGWTARAIGSAENRYLSFPNSEEVKRLVFNHDHALAGGKALVICEGPLDVLKVDWGIKDEGMVAVGTLGTAIVEKQVAVLMSLARRFEQTLIMFDPGASRAATFLMQKLASVRAKVISVPEGVEDPGALHPDDVLKCITSQMRRQ